MPDPNTRPPADPVVRTAADLSALDSLHPTSADAIRRFLSILELELGLDPDPWSPDS